MVWRQKDITASIVRLFESKYRPHGACWVWTSAIAADGYGQFHINRKPIRAHRASYLIYRGDLEDGKLVCHKCDVPSCVRPSHLFLSTPKGNSQDMVKKGRSLKGEKHRMAKLTEKKVLEIRATTGRSVDVGARFGVDPSLIRMIRRRDIWGHI